MLVLIFYSLAPWGLWISWAAERTAEPRNPLITHSVPSTGMRPSQSCSSFLRLPRVGKEFGSRLDLGIREKQIPALLKGPPDSLWPGLPVPSGDGRGGKLARIPTAECCVSLDRILNLAKPQISHQPAEQRVPALATSSGGRGEGSPGACGVFFE